jgi:hypothetical protein
MVTSAPPQSPVPGSKPGPDPVEALIEEARRRQRRRRQLFALALGLLSVIAAGAYVAVHLGGDASTQHSQPPVVPATARRSPIRVILTAQNHDPRASNSPYVHWGYCVKVRTAAGKAPPSRIHLLLEILKGRTPVAGVGEVWLNKGYDNWCGGIGGESNPLLTVERGKKLTFHAVVTTMGVTIKRNWLIVVR